MKPPNLHGSLGFFTMPATFSVPAGCLKASQELTGWAANYGTMADVMFSSLVHALAPEDERAPLLTEHIAIAAGASMQAITASVAVASNLKLVHRDVILDYLLLQQPTVSRARMAPFMGTHLMGLEPNEFYQEIMHLRNQQVMHDRLLDNFRNPVAIGTSQSRSVWIQGGTFCPQACSLNRCQQQQ